MFIFSLFISILDSGIKEPFDGGPMYQLTVVLTTFSTFLLFIVILFCVISMFDKRIIHRIQEFARSTVKK